MSDHMMDGPQGPEGAERQGPSRRTIIAGAAWTIPAISLAAATPAAAASEPTDYQLQIINWVNAPALGEDPVLQPDRIFNSRGDLRNDGPGRAVNPTIQVTFPPQMNADGFVAPDGWTMTVSRSGGDPNRWVLTLQYAGTLEPGQVVPFVVQARTAPAGAFRVDMNGPYNTLARAQNSDGTYVSYMTDTYRVERS